MTVSLAAPNHHNHGHAGQVDPGFGGPSHGGLGGVQVVDPNNPDPGFSGPSGGSLGGINVVNPVDPGFNGPSGHHKH